MLGLCNERERARTSENERERRERDPSTRTGFVEAEPPRSLSLPRCFVLVLVVVLESGQAK
jgi:hypothetical protein